MLTQTLPTLGTSYFTEPLPSRQYHQPATYANDPTSTPASLNPSSPSPTSTSTGLPTDPPIPHLPPELWLQIFPSILSSSPISPTDSSNPFPAELTNLHLVCRAFHSLLRQHERSLARAVLRGTFVRAPFPLLLLPGKSAAEDEDPSGGEENAIDGPAGGYPRGGERSEEERMGGCLTLEDIAGTVFPFADFSSSPAAAAGSCFTDVWVLMRRWRTWELCEGVWRTCTSWGPDFAWDRGKWERVHFWGMAGLFRLGDVGVCSRSEGGGVSGESSDPHSCEDEDRGFSPRPSPPASLESGSARPCASSAVSPANDGSYPPSPLPFSPSSSSLISALQSHTNRLTHLHSLPPRPLALLLFKLHTALRILRVLGPSPLRALSTPSPPHHPQPGGDSTPREPEMQEVWSDANGYGLTRFWLG
ncbi:hypothetical protein D0862_15012 [Hortaea werneckii]|uniref:Uncharacterized protein n=1 Tax=Hortaea werneckii TaxID=91943 RepID=A0A3M7DUY0_HORWE|nr:hypothetical protein D0862_15012 [Hortaea werneckii]